jgi:uncharacterized membrane protein YfcA
MLSARGVFVLYTGALLVLLLPAVYTAGQTTRRHTRHPRIVAALAGLIAGVEKAIIGGGFTVLLTAAQTAAGADLRSAIAASPLVKLPAFTIVAATYAARGYLDPLAAAALTIGALLSIPLAARLLETTNPRHIVYATTLAVTIAVLAALTRLFPQLGHNF